ncbi:aldehyde oxidase GLOX-like [Phoenix dactylifera]|uniref:Aldehyde oxidase GLOX-like n=1 Tax=Phoenix dactylifera TaxID=42345 RepID=A0A8B7D5T8_PHODC|nr:aldehyde oxidase GLOX-like [Phoenix dactylifera]
MKPTSALPLLFLFLYDITLSHSAAEAASGGGRWDLLQRSIGVSAMHMQLLHNDRVIIFDRTDFGPSNLSLPDGKCRHDHHERVLKIDCTAHSAEYDVVTNTFRPLTIHTDTWCSSGSVDPDGRLIQTGGSFDGERAIRTFFPCTDSRCDWKEVEALAVPRWYATNQILPDGRAIIIGGRLQFSYEFYPKSNPSTAGITNLEFLLQTRDVEENNLYPFVHLNVDGNLFIFANNRAILLDYTKNNIVGTYPPVPGGDPRSYPSTGSSVLLPLESSGEEAEVLICGGAPRGSFMKAIKNEAFVGALSTCGRIKITDPSPTWFIETMPTPRVMGDMILLPSGKEVLIINGAAAGAAGWELGRSPVMIPVVYCPGKPVGARFEVQNSSSTARLYHSSAILLRDGRILVGGSNPHENYVFSGVDYPTELSLEAFSPDYLGAEHSILRPRIIEPRTPLMLNYGKQFSLRFKARLTSNEGVSVTMVAPSFSTHSFSMNQRLLILKSSKAATIPSGSSTHEIGAVAPKSRILAPPGYYMFFIVNGRIPGEGIWVHIQ